MLMPSDTTTDTVFPRACDVVRQSRQDSKQTLGEVVSSPHSDRLPAESDVKGSFQRAVLVRNQQVSLHHLLLSM
eukprot:755174-Hanusia_phi.AAC.2